MRGQLGSEVRVQMRGYRGGFRGQVGGVWEDLSCICKDGLL